MLSELQSQPKKGDPSKCVPLTVLCCCHLGAKCQVEQDAGGHDHEEPAHAQWQRCSASPARVSEKQGCGSGRDATCGLQRAGTTFNVLRLAQWTPGKAGSCILTEPMLLSTELHAGRCCLKNSQWEEAKEVGDAVPAGHKSDAEAAVTDRVGIPSPDDPSRL